MTRRRRFGRSLLRRRYGAVSEAPPRAPDGHELTFVEEYVHDHAEIIGAAAGAGLGALEATSFSGGAGAVVGGILGAGIGLAVRRSKRRRKVQ